MAPFCPWGYDLSNTSPPFMHLTEIGRRTLSRLSRDPYNPEGYLAAIRPLLASGSVALSYLDHRLCIDPRNSNRLTVPSTQSMQEKRCKKS